VYVFKKHFILIISINHIDWTTSDLMTIDPALFSSGMETFLSILLRGGTQRTFDTSGQYCSSLLQARTDQVIISFSSWSLILLYTVAAVQLLLSVGALLCGSPWLYKKIVISPALRAVRDPTYFMCLLSESPFMSLLHETCNAQKYVIWQKLDIIVKIGAQLEPLDEHVGKIRMDK
jgi:hypothetical protein